MAYKQQLTGNTIWVDVNLGSSYGEINRSDKPFDTIAAALALASSYDTIMVLPGNYEEVGLVIGSKKTLKSTGGERVTTIGDASAIGYRVSVSAGTVLEGFTITLPSSKGETAIHCQHSGTTDATLTNIIFEGTTSGEGTGLVLDTTGNMVCTNIRFSEGDCLYIIDASEGVLQVDGFHVPNKAGTIESCIKIHTGAIGEINNMVIDGSGNNGTINNGIQAGPHQVTTLVTFDSSGGNFINGDYITIGSNVTTLSASGPYNNIAAATEFVDKFVADFELLSATDHGDGTATVLVGNETLVDMAIYYSIAGVVTFPITNIVEVKFDDEGGTFDPTDDVTLAGNTIVLTSLPASSDKNAAAARYATNLNTSPTDYTLNAVASGKRVNVSLASQGLITFNDDHDTFTATDTVTIGTNDTILVSATGSAIDAALRYVTAFGADDDVFTAEDNLDGTVNITLRTEVSLATATYSTTNDAIVEFLGTVANNAANGSYNTTTSATVEFNNEYPQICTVVANSINLAKLDNAITLSSNTVDVRIVSGVLDADLANFKVDSGLTGKGGVFRASVHMDPKFNIPTTWISSDHGWTFFTKNDLAEKASYQLWGVDQAIGHPEFGSGISAGEGLSYSTNNTVLTATGGTLTSNGTVISDISVAAQSKDGSTFTFNNGVDNDVIMWCTKRKDGSANTLKYWGFQLNQVAAASLGSGDIYVEYQTGGTNWARLKYQAVSVEDQYRYASDGFLRANSYESYRVDTDTLLIDWDETTISGQSGYWMRIRINGTITTPPTFERLQLVPSHSQINSKGIHSLLGLAQYRNTLFGSGNTWGDGASGGEAMKDTNTLVSSLGWIQKNKKSRFEADGANNTFQFAIPGGICTAYPIKFNLSVSTPSGSLLTDASITLRALPLKLEGVNTADIASGGIVPIQRLLADATDYTTAVPQVITLTDEDIPLNKIKTVSFSFDFSDYYEDDMVLLNIIANDGAGNILTGAHCLDMWTLTIEAVAFTSGKVL